MPEQWGYTNKDSQIEFQEHGLSNIYDLAKQADPEPEYITIYDPSASLKSRVISAILILAVIGFCGLLFSFLTKDKNTDSTAQAVAQTVK